MICFKWIFLLNAKVDRIRPIFIISALTYKFSWNEFLIILSNIFMQFRVLENSCVIAYFIVYDLFKRFSKSKNILNSINLNWVIIELTRIQIKITWEYYYVSLLQSLNNFCSIFLTDWSRILFRKEVLVTSFDDILYSIIYSTKF